MRMDTALNPRLVWAVGAFAALVLSGPAPTAAQGARVETFTARIMQADTNDDDRISLQEAKDQASARFDMLDTDGDGLVGRDAFAAAAEDRMADARAERFAARDTDGDGTLSKDEFTATAERKRLARRMFRRLDADDSGAVTPAELEAGLQAMRERRGTDLDQRVDAYFDRADSNGDGQLDRAEHLAQVTERFQANDRNGDDMLTQAEIRAAIESRRADRAR